MILQVLLIKFIYFLLSLLFSLQVLHYETFRIKILYFTLQSFATIWKKSNIGQLKIELSDSFDMTCSNFTNHRVVRNLKFYRCLYFVLCIVFSGAYSNCILENLVRIYQTGHNGTQNFIKSLFLYIYNFTWRKTLNYVFFFNWQSVLDQ